MTSSSRMAPALIRPTSAPVPARMASVTRSPEQRLLLRAMARRAHRSAAARYPTTARRRAARAGCPPSVHDDLAVALSSGRRAVDRRPAGRLPPVPLPPHRVYELREPALASALSTWRLETPRNRAPRARGRPGSGRAWLAGEQVAVRLERLVGEPHDEVGLHAASVSRPRRAALSGIGAPHVARGSCPAA